MVLRGEIEVLGEWRNGTERRNRSTGRMEGLVLRGEAEVLGEWRNGTEKGNRSTGRKTCPRTNFSTTSLTWTELESKPGLPGW